MARSASITVGTYVYIAQDAKGTLDEMNDIWGHHTHVSTIPDGWLAGARGFLAEFASLAGIKLPSLDNVDSAFAVTTAAIEAKYDELTPAQIESLLIILFHVDEYRRDFVHPVADGFHLFVGAFYFFIDVGGGRL